MHRIDFGMIGCGWRGEFFLRIAKALPDRFRLNGILIRDQMKGKQIEDKWGVKTYTSFKDFIRQQEMSFVVVSVPRDIAPMMIKQLVEKDIPVLTETPPAQDVENLSELYELVKQGAKIQVAEQYQFQPLHAARIALAMSGKIGNISQVQISICHEYHAISLMRLLLGIKFEDAKVIAKAFESPIVAGPDRNGLPRREKIKKSRQIMAHFNFTDKLGIYDFVDDQYFSWIRAQRLLIRGDKGEIKDQQITYLKDYQTPITIDLKRVNTGENGNLEGYYLKGILAGDEWVYRNPFEGARLTDDEIAVATSLVKMEEYVRGGKGFYSLAQGAQDQYLSLVMRNALQTGDEIRTNCQMWGECN